jgi:protein TonB
MLISFLLHVAAVLLVFLLAQSPLNPLRLPKSSRNGRAPIILAPVPSPSKGGGGSRSVTPPSKGRLPRYAMKQFVPLMVAPTMDDPKLVVEPTILLASLRSQSISDSPIGLPSGLPGPPSGGPGGISGIGDGDGGGAGNRSGSAVEGILAEPLRVGIKAPVAIYKLEPEYSEPARKARVQGTVVLEGIIDDKGFTHALKVRDGLGFGLDEQAIEAVKKWRFRPATRAGKPLAIIGTFYLTFRLL